MQLEMEGGRGEGRGLTVAIAAGDIIITGSKQVKKRWRKGGRSQNE